MTSNLIYGETIHIYFIGQLSIESVAYNPFGFYSIFDHFDDMVPDSQRILEFSFTGIFKKNSNNLLLIGCTEPQIRGTNKLEFLGSIYNLNEFTINNNNTFIVEQATVIITTHV